MWSAVPCNRCDPMSPVTPGAAAAAPEASCCQRPQPQAARWGGLIPSLTVLRTKPGQEAGAWDSPSTACNPAGEIGVFRPSLSLNAYEWTNVPLRAPKDGYGEQQSYKFQPACSELGEDGKQREKAKGLLVRWSRNFLFPHFKQ